MESKYNVIFIYADKKAFINQIEKDFKKNFKDLYDNIIENNIDKTVNFLHNTFSNISEGPTIILYFASLKCKISDPRNNMIIEAIKKGYLLIPIIEKNSDFNNIMPEILLDLNAFIWEGEQPLKKLNGIIFENLGLSEKDRRLFISYKRSDGSGMADQLFDMLTHQRFDVFLDRYNIEYGYEIEKKIFQAIEDKAFLLILESPEAYESDYVSKEINYALEHSLALLIISFPGVETEIENTQNLPRYYLKIDDIIEVGGDAVIKNEKLEDLILEIEAFHANGLNRRRNLLIRSIELEMKKKYDTIFYIDNWILILKDSRNQENNQMVSITPRTPKSLDLYKLDQIEYKNNDIERILYYQAENILDIHAKMLKWIIREKLNLKILNYI